MKLRGRWTHLIGHYLLLLCFIELVLIVFGTR